MVLANLAVLAVSPRGSFGMLMIGCVLILPTLLVDIAVFGLIAEDRVMWIVEGVCMLAGGIAYGGVTVIYARRGMAMAWGRYRLLPRNLDPSWFRQSVVINLCLSAGLIVLGFLKLFP